MAKTTIPIELSSTPSIVDGGNATAITIDSSENVTFAGGLVIPSTITHAGDTDTKLDFNQANTLRLITGDNTAWICSASSMVINEDSIDFDFRVESNGNANMLFVDGGNDRVGVACSDPTAYLEIDPAAADTAIFSIRRQDHATIPLFKIVQDSSVSQGTGHCHITSSNRDMSITAGENLDKTKGLYIKTDGTVLFGKTSASVDSVGGYILGGEAIMSITSGANTYLVRNTSSSAYSFYVGGDGEIHAANTTIASLSDERLKENIKPLETGLDEVMSLQPRRFDWKEGEGSGKKNLSGFIAQEVEKVLPDLVGEYLHDDLDDAKSVRTGDMIPTLVKAIQEQQTLIESLTARIETLEG